jgi:hypothetical protein
LLVEKMTTSTCITMMIKQWRERSHSYNCVRSISAEVTKGPVVPPSPPSPQYQELYFMFELRIEYCNSFNLPKIYCTCQRRNVCLSEIMKFM